MYTAVVDVKPESCSYNMKPLYSRSSRVKYQHITPRITNNFQNMGMAAYKNVRFQFINEFTRPRIIPSRIASDMSHQHFHTLALEKPV